MNYKALEFKLKKANFLYAKYGLNGTVKKILNKKKTYETYNEWLSDRAISDKEL